MPKRKNFAVLGASNFSLAVIKTLVDKRQKVTVFDNNPEQLDLTLSDYDNVDKIILDATNKSALEKNAIKTFDGIVVGFGSSMETSLIAVLNLLDLGCDNIIARARDEKHRRILKAIGLADNQISTPDEIAGNTVGSRLVYDIDVNIDIQSSSDDYFSTVVTVKNPDVFNKTLDELNLINNKDFNIIQIRRAGKVFLPDENTILKEGDVVTLFAASNVINEIVNKLQGPEKDHIEEPQPSQN
ncbi:potassium channel family protein [Mesoplasma lactucae]|uniref:Potassium transporter TrkA n=1 Tax=Mesoplasma lactucae ATCC 49193 TaxID=81460 RepID=A0A291ISE1_9MOLU|nr:TrkA family potassium uptake protein [Mesoplasma lactucae]ATG97607.1 potassium transporter TrkA [Mesoplasma lactucae ATCC 49193]ATZ19932.1 potassium uptake protein KtrA [Mesoplasma lactucae ATCC 49193]MCL8216796.1 Ktr system potassium uptake protein A [Mesoplasma lactucae ATCC 49193]